MIQTNNDLANVATQGVLTNIHKTLLPYQARNVSITPIRVWEQR